MTKERILIVAAVLIMVAIGIYAADRVAKPADLVIVPQTIHEETAKPATLLNVEYPTITGFKSKSSELSFNETLKSLIEGEIAAFKEETKNSIPYPDEVSQRSEFGSKYEIGVATSTLVSIRFNNYAYSAGAAHPLSYVVAFNYDITRNKLIGLGDLFTVGSPYLQRISEKATAGLEEKFKEDLEGLADWIKTGAAPKEENYQLFEIKPEGLVVIFNPYQVGPYVIGVPDVTIPYSDLQDIISEQGPLSIFIAPDTTSQ